MSDSNLPERKNMFNQFPSGDYTDTIYPQRNSITGEFKIDEFTRIGWSMRNYNNHIATDGITRLITKRCNGIVRCQTENCDMKGTALKPGSASLHTQNKCKKGCLSCKRPLIHIDCQYIAKFSFSGGKCSVEPGNRPGQNYHTHDSYINNKLNNNQKEQLMEHIKAGVSPKELHMGMSKKRDDLHPAREIHPSLQNKDKLTYEMKKIRNEDQNKPTSAGTDSLKEFLDLQDEYPGYISECSLLRGQFIVAAYPPKLQTILDPSAHPFVTDVTFSVFEKGYYLCTSMLFCECLQRNVVAFSAILNGLTSMDFELYFLVLFDTYKITFDSEFMGVVMDFSDAQRAGFLQAYEKITGRDDGIKYVKGCSVHYETNIKKLCQSYVNDIHNGDEKKKMEIQKELLLLRVVDTRKKYKNILEKVVNMYPNSRSFINWWNRKEVRGTIFPAVSTMHNGLFTHYTHTTNAVESFHNAIYKLTKKRQSIIVNLRNILKYIENEEESYAHYLRGIPTFYGLNNETRKRRKSIKKRKNKKRKIDNYKNDGRAPDNKQALRKANKKNRKYVIEVSDCDEDESDGSTSDVGDNKKFETFMRVMPLNGDIDTDEEFPWLDEHQADNDEDNEENDEENGDESSVENGVESDEANGDESDEENDDESDEENDDESDEENDDKSDEENDDKSDEENDGGSKEDEDDDANKENGSGRRIDDEDKWQQQPQLKDKEKMEDESGLPGEYYSGYLLNLLDNSYGSCYIDAPMEMLLHSILPSIPEVDRKFDINNSYDEILKKAYKLYSSNNIINREKGMQVLREFIWKHPNFPKGTFNDTALLFEHFLSHMSNEIQQLFAVHAQRITTCADKESHAVIHEEESGYKVLIHISFYQVFSRKRNITHNEQETCDVFSTFIYNHLTNKKVGRKCAVALCPSLATRKNTLVSFPRFLFIQDHTAAQTGDNMLEYPKKLDIQGHKYTLHARINSKTRTGFHYYTIATIPNRGIPFIGTIDNMAGYISIPSIRHNRKNQLQQSPNYPVIVCYHKDDC